jgi:dihydrofolate reductase
MRVSLIAAMAANRVIGQTIDGMHGLPWHLPADLRRFKAVTMGHTLIMGRKTYDSVGRPLPGRRTIVVTRQPGWSAAGVAVAHSLCEALQTAAAEGIDEVFVAGGGEIFREALPHADRIHLTRIARDFPGDVFFPELDATAWRIVEQEHHEASDETPYAFTFEVLDRR